MTFWGHHTLIARLETFLQSGNTSRSFLFIGPPHSGKHTLALAFSAAYTQGEETIDMQAQRTSETVCIAPEREEKKGILKEKALDIGQIREGVRLLALSTRGGRTAMVVDEAHRMTREAQNALLKTLEEPTEGAVIVLVARSVDALLPTVVSRCEQMRFGSVSYEAFGEHFGENAPTLWRVSMGLPGLAQIFLQDEAMFARRTNALNRILDIDAMEFMECMRWAEALSKNIPDTIETLEMFAFAFRDQGIRGDVEKTEAFQRTEKMMECARLLRDTQVNARLILENTLINL